MSDESLDVLVDLYRHQASELPSADVDARMLRLSEHRYKRNPWAWRTTALAACLLLTVALLAARLHAPTSSRMVSPMAGYDEGRAAAYLMQAEFPIPRSPVAQSLLTMESTAALRPLSMANPEK